MPNYSFRNKTTGEEYEISLSMSEREEYLSSNPDIEQILTRVAVADPVRLGVTKPPSDFSKYVLGKVKETNPLGGAVERRHNITREW